jgi:hypothetical protein
MTGFGRPGSFGVAVLAAVVFVVGACGGGSGSPDGGAGGSTGAAGSTTGAGGFAGGVVGNCQQVVSTLCTRLLSCGVVDGGASFVESDCEKSERVEFGCDRAASATTPFPNCLSDVRILSCASLFPPAGVTLPASCDGLNTIPLSTAQTKCADLAGADCMRAAQCLNITPTADQLQQCQIDDYTLNGCGFATDVGATYQQCLTDLGTAPCPPDGGAPPDAGLPSCMNAIVFVQ